MNVGIVGLGYVGLPLAVAFCEAGHNVIGIDVDPRKVGALQSGESYIEDVPSETLEAVSDRLFPSLRFAELSRCEAVILAVPTPLTRNREPDLAPLLAATTSVAGVLQRDQLIVLESTT
jgi:UDP-N-acetyl-D-glucosamine dehydrogenase